MTREDLFQLELLADGELDEESRRDLLERLDRTDDGWRYCAMAFLQAQCLGESLGGENPFAETGSEDSSEKSAGVLAAPAFDLRPTEPARPETALRRKRTLRIAALMSSACALLLVGLVGVRFFADRGGGPRVPNVKTESRYAEVPNRTNCLISRRTERRSRPRKKSPPNLPPMISIAARTPSRLSPTPER